MGKRLARLVVVALTLCVASCDRAAPVVVTGSVTLDRQPLSRGTVEFQPLDNGQFRLARVENGEFVLSESEGLLPGQEYKVVIKAFRKTGRRYRNREVSTDEEVQYLPEAYNARSTLRVTISKRDAENRFAFDLTSAADRP